VKIIPLFFILIFLPIPAFALDVSVNSNSISILSDTPTNISLFSSFYVPVTFSENNFIIQNGTTKIVNYSFAQNVNSGQYNGAFFAVWDNGVIRKDFTTVIPNNTNFNITFPQSVINVTLTNGEVYYNISNTGNTPFNPIVISSCGWISNMNQIISPFTSSTGFLTYKINKTQPNYTCSVNFSAGNVTTFQNLTFYVTDDQAPIINSVRLLPDNQEAGHFVIFEVNTTDNFNVTRVQATVTGTYVTTTFDINLTDDGIWRGRWTPWVPDSYDVSISVQDAANNGVTMTKYLTVTPITSTIIEHNQINFYTKKFDNTYSKDMITFTEPYQINITLSQLKLSNTTPVDFTYTVTTPMEIISNIPFGNSTYLQPFTGTATLSVYSTGFVDYDGIFYVEHPSILNISNQIEFVGRFSNYTFTEPTSLQLANTNMDCKTNDAQSKYVCTLEYPPDVELSQLLVPLTKEQYDGMLGIFNVQHTTDQNEINSTRNWEYFFFAVLILSWVGFIVIKEILPKVRFKSG